MFLSADNNSGEHERSLGKLREFPTDLAHENCFERTNQVCPPHTHTSPLPLPHTHPPMPTQPVGRHFTLLWRSNWRNFALFFVDLSRTLNSTGHISNQTRRSTRSMLGDESVQNTETHTLLGRATRCLRELRFDTVGRLLLLHGRESVR